MNIQESEVIIIIRHKTKLQKEIYFKSIREHLLLNKVINRCLAKEKQIHGMKFSVQIFKVKITQVVHYCLRKGTGNSEVVKEHSQLNIKLEKVKSLLLSFEFTNIKKNKRKNYT